MSLKRHWVLGAIANYVHMRIATPAFYIARPSAIIHESNNLPMTALPVSLVPRLPPTSRVD